MSPDYLLFYFGGHTEMVYGGAFTRSVFGVCCWESSGNLVVPGTKSRPPVCKAWHRAQDLPLALLSGITNPGSGSIGVGEPYGVGDRISCLLCARQKPFPLYSPLALYPPSLILYHQALLYPIEHTGTKMAKDRNFLSLPLNLGGNF